jgi:hypothetical protein
VSEEEKSQTSPADGPGEAVLDEPTEHALDPEKDPNTEWEKSAEEQLEAGTGDSGPG